VETGSSSGRSRVTQTSTSDSSEPDPAQNNPAPPAPSTSNFIQNGNQQYPGQFSFQENFADSFYLRGDQIDIYLNGTSFQTTPVCFVARFANSTNNQLLVLPAFVQFFNNISTGTTEYFYQVMANDSQVAQSVCNTVGLNTTLGNLYVGETIAYAPADVCATCSSAIAGTPVKLYSTSGSELTQITMSQLSLEITPEGNAPPGGGLCTTSAQCTSIGYDCCLNGQCVVDGASIPGTSPSNIALADILANPGNYTNWPQYYYVCANGAPPEPTPTPTVDPSILAQQRVESLADLYGCTTVDDEGFSTCVKSTEDADVLIAASSTTFTGSNDDINFYSIYQGSNGSYNQNNIVKVTYADVTLYDYANSIAFDTSIANFANSGNDLLTSSQDVTITMTADANATNKTVKLYYKVDGTCEYISSTLAKCYKKYVQAQNTGLATDHLNTTQVYKLPTYADITNYPVIVKVDDQMVPTGTTTWQTNTGTSSIDFAVGYTIYDSQTVEITYYVDDATTVSNLTSSRVTAQNEINTYCTCNTSDGNCSLTPITQTQGGQEVIVDYECTYPDNTPTTPLQQTVFVSSHAVPHRYFNASGVAQDSGIDYSTAAQEASGAAAFEYTDNNVLKPNNIANDIGADEVYGSMSMSAMGAKPPKMVQVVKNRTYNLFTNSGQFSTCFTCQNDYYGYGQQRVFPETFGSLGSGYWDALVGGGYTPNFNETSRTENSTPYRSDDLIFGRACFVPMTMIPWTHSTNTDRQTQRLNRLNAQHFLFANGYQRDWYGFDYGSLIGSFDGVTWFSVGNSRQIKAKTNRLYLAVNAYFGDLATSGDFSVTVSEVDPVYGSGSTIDHDTESHGAQCQKLHICDTDQDCVTRLGWDYSCQNVTSIKTTWPKFDDEAGEIPNDEDLTNLISLVGGSNSLPKRCVYRGRGAPCHGSDYNSVAAADSYSRTTTSGLHACNPNYYCEELSTAGKFNTRITRYAKSPAAQNADSDVVTEAGESDIVGKGARIIGRPLKWNGTDSVSSALQTQLGNNQVDEICLPGKDPDQTDATTQMGISPSTPNGDKILGLGVSKDDSTSHNLYLTSCPTFDENGNFIHLTTSNTVMGTNLDWIALSSEQNITSNALDPDYGWGGLGNSGDPDVLHSGTGIIETLKLQKNACLRAPGSTCHTDLDCAPSKFIAQRTAGIDTADVSIPEAELKFWQEELVCGQKARPTHNDYDLRENKCCRDLGNTFTVYTADTDNNLSHYGIVGTFQSLSSTSRYSRTGTGFVDVYADLALSPNTNPSFPILNAPAANSTLGGASTNFLFTYDSVTTYSAGNPYLNKQFKTLDLIGNKTSCSGHWIRNFSTENGGGHYWTQGRTQNISKEVFKFVMWENNNPATNPFECSANSADDNWEGSTGCEILNFTVGGTTETQYLEWLEKFELTGIPQIMIPADADAGAMMTRVDTDQLTSASVLDNTLSSSFTLGTDEDAIIETHEYASAADMTNFASTIKQVFSETEITSCLPSGEEVDITVHTDAICCTGKIAANQNNVNRCCLEDYTDISVYLNRYVSSEANHLADGMFDPKTGYITDPAVVLNTAASKDLCCSGRMAYGRAISTLPIPGAEAAQRKVRRFAYQQNDNYMPQGENYAVGPADAYDLGVRWNNHVYCVPQGYQGN